MVLGVLQPDAPQREEFGRRYEPVIRSYLAARWRLPVDHERISDATQEVFLRIFAPGGPLERVKPGRSGGFRAFLHGIVNNVAREFERRARRRSERIKPDQPLDDLAQSEVAWSQAFDKAWAEMVSREAWDLMVQRHGHTDLGRLRFEVLGLRYVDGLPPREIVRRLAASWRGTEEIDVKDVYQMISTGRQQYRNALLTIVSKYHPEVPAEEIERHCENLAGRL